MFGGGSLKMLAMKHFYNAKITFFFLAQLLRRVYLKMCQVSHVSLAWSSNLAATFLLTVSYAALLIKWLPCGPLNT